MNENIDELDPLLIKLSKVFELTKSNEPGFELIDFVTDEYEENILSSQLLQYLWRFCEMDENDPDYFDLKYDIHDLWCNLNANKSCFCVFDKYVEQYPVKLNQYLSRSIDSMEVDFIELELKILNVIVKSQYQCQIKNDNLYPDLSQMENYARSAKRKIEFLKFRSKVAIQNRNEVFRSQLKDDAVEENIDYSDNKQGERITILHELGVLDYLKEIKPFNTSTNKLAEVLSSFMGVSQSSIQSYINPIDNKNVDQSKTALTPKNLEQAHLKLINMRMDSKGFKSNKK